MSATNPDTDGDQLTDGEEIADRSDPFSPDGGDDGLLDGDEETTQILQQRVSGFLDGLTCPTVGVLGSISVLGTTANFDDATTFDDGTCADLAARLVPSVPPGPANAPVFVKVKNVEDSVGLLTATEVDVEGDSQHIDDDRPDGDFDHHVHHGTTSARSIEGAGLKR